MMIMDNIAFDSKEIKFIKKMFWLATCIKYLIVALIINFLPLLLFCVNDFIKFENNVSRDQTIIYIYIVMFIESILLITWAICYIILRKNLNSDLWQNILKKLGNNQINSDMAITNYHITSTISTYLIGDLISKCEKLENFGNALKNVSGIVVMFLIIKSCSLIIDFCKSVFKIYNIKLKSNNKFILTILVLPALVISIVNFVLTLNGVVSNNKHNSNMINLLKKNCVEKKYCSSVTLSKNNNTINFREGENVSVLLKLNNKGIEEIALYFDYNKNILKEDIIYDANEKLSQLFDLINLSNIKCAYNFLCKKYQLSEDFVNKFSKLNDSNMNIETSVSDEYQLENKYIVKTFAYITDDGNGNPTDTILMSFALKKLNY